MEKEFDIELTTEENNNEPGNVQLPLNFLSFGEIEPDDVKVYIKQDVYKALEKYASSDTSKELGTILIGDYCEQLGKTHVVISDYTLCRCISAECILYLSGLVRVVVVSICVAKGGATHMTTLEDLYYGNISPHERYIKRGTRVDKLVKLICKNEEELNAGLTEKQKETFEKFKDCTSELSCITEREAFSSGFILATRIMVEVMEGLQEVEDI